MAWLWPKQRIVIRGAGDLASGVAYRLVITGVPVVMTELATPLLVRRTVSYGNAIFEGGQYHVEGLHSQWVAQPDQVDSVLERGHIPILVGEGKALLEALQPTAVIDARMQKRNIDTLIHDAALVIGMGPGFTAGLDCHAVIETQRGHTLGRVLWDGTALPDTGTPGEVAGYKAERVLRAPQAGHVQPAQGVGIGSQLAKGDPIAHINGDWIHAPFPGVLRGLIHPSVLVWPDLKIGDLDPRGEVSHCYSISDKALAIGGGVVEAVFTALQRSV
jgi:xanthine dehydrogenase accessory factor